MHCHACTASQRHIATPGKGILAADESNGTIGKRFDQITVENTADNRRKYRELLVTTAGLSEHIAGVILFDETARQTVYACAASLCCVVVLSRVG